MAGLPGGRAGMAFSSGGGGVDDVVHVYARRGKLFAETGTIALGHKAGNGADVKPQTAGVAVAADGRRALVANYYNDSVSLFDLDRRVLLAERDLRPGKIDPRQSGVAGGENPFAILWTSADRAWVSAPRDRQLVELAVGAAGVDVTKRVATLGEPTALLFDARAQRLFAVEDNADRLAIVDSRSGKLAAEPRLALPEALRAQPLGKGLNPNGL